MRAGRVGIRLVGISVLAVTVATSGGLATATRGGAAAPTPTYQVEDLGTLDGDYASAAMGINQRGDVVGWSMGPNGTRAFVYTDASGMTALPALAGRPVTTARAVNDDGVAVGTAATGGSDIGHAVRWKSGGATDLGTLDTGLFSEANGINAAGVIVGSSYTDGGSALGIHAFQYDDTAGLVDLTPATDNARAEAINELGQVAGWRNGHAFRRTGTTFTDLGVAPGFGSSFGVAINDAGQVAGHVITASGNSEQIFRYTDADGIVILGGSGELNRASGINSAGDVVGWGRPDLGLKQGFLFTDGDGMRGLNSLIDPAAGWFVLGAGDINDAGQIAGWASGPSGHRAVRLTHSNVNAPPAAPSALSASVLSRSRVRLNWADNSANETGFRIDRSVGTHARFVLLAKVGADTTSYTDRTGTAGQAYRYRIRAFNATGPSAWSEPVTVVTG